MQELVMPKSIEQTALYKIVNPEHIAMFGASNRFAAMGTNLLSSILALGYEGDIYPIHPEDDQVMGLDAYKSVLDLPITPDLAFIVLPTKVVPEILEECGKKGIKQAIIVSGGFKEVGGHGIALEKQICDIADKYGMRFVGPNCIGAVNPHHKFNATYFPYQQAPGFIGMASQSGSFITQMFDYLASFGLGYSTGISVGNEANIDIVDCLEYLGACPHTRVISLYIETIRRGREFIEMARSIVPHKPIVAYYVGGSEGGRKATFSHTGALSGPDRLYDGIFRQSGVIRANSIEEMFDYCLCFGMCPRPAGNRVVVQTHSGGPGAVAADVCTRQGLVLNPITDQTLEKLKQYVPHTGSTNNPIDITYSKNSMDYFVDIPKVLVEDEASDSVLIYFLMPDHSVRRAMESYGISGEQAIEQAGAFIDEQSKAVAELIKGFSKPFIGFSFYTRENRFIKNLQDNGVAVLSSPVRAAKALAAMVRYTDYRKKILVAEKAV
jgi:acetyl-CoA synthetase (ADP-forming)